MLQFLVLAPRFAKGGEQFDDLERMLVTDLADELARAVGPGAAAILERPSADPLTVTPAEVRPVKVCALFRSTM